MSHNASGPTVATGHGGGGWRSGIARLENGWCTAPTGTPQRRHGVSGVAHADSTFLERFPDPAEISLQEHPSERRSDGRAPPSRPWAQVTALAAPPSKQGRMSRAAPLYSRLGVERVSTRAEQRRACLRRDKHTRRTCQRSPAARGVLPACGNDVLSIGFRFVRRAVRMAKMRV